MTAPQNANVVLTADSSQYQASVQQSAQQTSILNKTLDQLNEKLDGITKRAGKKLFAFTAADMAVFGTGVAAAATFEKQLSSLQATTTVTKANFAELKGGIEDTFTSLPVARGQVIQLSEALTQLGRTSAKDINELTKTFLKLGAATGEGPTELAQGLTQLSQLMGTTSTGRIENYANALLTVSKNAGVSATSVTNFAQSIAPLARQAGIGEAQILGISTAFSKAGADGFVATNVFNGLVSQITNLSQTGSPELEKYSKLIGVTADQFKKMDKTEAITSIFESISKQGPKAIQTLNQLGIDGVRAQSAISAVVQSGDLRKSVSQAVGASNDTKNLDKASETAFSGLADSLAKVRNQFTQFGTEIGAHLVGPLSAVTELFAKTLNIANQIIKPFTPLIDAVGALVGAFTAMGGAALLAFGVISKLATLRFALTSSPIAALRGGFAAGRNPDAVNPASAAFAAGQMRPYQRGFYTFGAGLGRTVGPGVGTGPSLIGRGVSAVARAPLTATSFLARTNANFFRDSTRDPFQRSGDMRFREAAAAGSATPGATSTSFFGNMRTAFSRGRNGTVFNPAAPSYTPFDPSRAMPGAPLGTASNTRLFAGAAGSKLEEQGKRAAEARVKADTAATKAANEGAKATRGAAAASVAGGAASRSFGGSVAKATGDVVRLGAAASAAGARMAAQGVGMAAGALGRIASSPLGILGLSVALPSILGAFSGDDKEWKPSDEFNPISKYDEKLGGTSTNLAKFTTEVDKASDRLKTLAGQNASGQQRVTSSDVSQAGSDYKPTDKVLGGFNRRGEAGAGAQYIAGLAAQHGGLDAQYLQSIKLDLVNQVGPRQAQRVLDEYFKMPGAGSGSGITNYSTLGRSAGSFGRDDFSQAANNVASYISTQSEFRPGKSSSRAKFSSFFDYISSIDPKQIDENDRKSLNAASKKLLGVDVNTDNGRYAYSIDFQNEFNKMSQTNRRSALIGRSFTTDDDNKFDKGQTTLARELGISSKALQSAANDAKRNYLNGRAKADIDPVELNRRVGEAVSKLIPKGSFGKPLDPNTAEYKAITSNSPLGKFAADQLKDVIGVGKDIANPQAQVKAQDQLKAKSMELSGSLDKSADALDKLANTAERNAEPALAALARAAAASQRQTFETTVVPTMTRGQVTRYRYDDYQKARAANRGPDANEATAQREAEAKSAYEQQEESNRQHLLSMYMTLRSYNLQMERSYQDFYKSVYRQQRDFNIQMEKGQRDFNIQRNRQQRDFDIQLGRQAEDAAKSIYDPFARVYDKQTTDVGTLMMNLTEQNNRISMQYANLRKLKKAGISQETIDTLNLADPQNAQQLQTVVDGIADNPELVSKINKSIRKRQKVTAGLTQSDFNETFRRTIDDYKRGLKDTADDFNRSRQDAEEAFKRGMNDMATDFHTMVTRTQEDLNESLKEITGKFEELLPKTFSALGVQIGKYAPKYAKTIQDAINSITPPDLGGSGGGSSSGGGGGGGGPAGSKSNPIYKAGMVGISESGKIGSYDAKGNFTMVGASTAEGLRAGGKLKYIGNPKNDIVKRHIAKTPAESRKYARAKMLQKYGWGDNQWNALNQLWSHESAWQPTVGNHEGSGAYGIPQALPGDKMASAGSDWRWNGATQVDWGLGYIKGRYGTPAKAWAFWQNPGTGPNVSHGHWYDNGGVLEPGVHKQVTNATGKAELILTHKQLKALRTNGMGSQVMNTYKIMNDNSATFRDITVVASDPMAMAKALQQRARLAKLAGQTRS